MIKFFRKIRQSLLREGKVSRYLLYALGEIVLVVIGILIALQINNWNHEHKERHQEVKLYENLLESLTADSIDLQRVHGRLDRGMSALRFLINTPHQELISDHSAKAIRDSIAECKSVGSSFFPRFSAYEEITSNGYLALISSDEIKSKLAELYDRKYLRYQHIDASIDKKSEMHFEPIISGDLQIRHDNSGLKDSESFDLELFEKFNSPFIRECNSIFNTSFYAKDALNRCSTGVNELILLISEELKHQKT